MNNSGRFIFKNDTQKILDHINEDKFRNYKRLSKIEGQINTAMEDKRACEQFYDTRIPKIKQNLIEAKDEFRRFCKNEEGDIFSNTQSRDIFKKLSEKESNLRLELEKMRAESKKTRDQFKLKTDDLVKQKQKIENKIARLESDIEEEIKKALNTFINKDKAQ